MIPAILPTYNRANLAFDHGDGSWLVTSDGHRYLDFTSGIAVNALGHGYPDLVAVVQDQAAKLWHVSNLYQIPQQEQLAEALVDKTFADTVFFTNSGTESCELAVKMARKYWHSKGTPERNRIIGFTGSFHGRSSAGIAAAGGQKLTEGFGPLLPGFTHLPFGDLEALDGVILDDDIAAVILEPVQGEGGIVPIEESTLRAIREMCDGAGVLLIFDEVQCGMGRTGRLFAHEWAGVTPDIMMVAKGIGGGFPLGAVLATEAAAQGMVAGTHGSTYGGNPLACAVGNKVVEIVSEPTFLDDVSRRAGFLRQRLEGLVASYPQVFEEVRGKGLMLGLKCKIPNTDVVAAGLEAGVLTVGASDNVVRVLPALNISEDEINEGVARLDAAAAALSAT